MTRKICIGNWKMNSNLKTLNTFKSIPSFNTEKVGIGIAPPYCYLKDASLEFDQKIILCAQDCSFKEEGAFTGEVSTKMLKEFNVQFVILGHSERRILFSETNEKLQQKIQCCKNNLLKIIFCVGETLKEREDGLTKNVLKEQLRIINLKDDFLKDEIIIAYEPVWAIGTGKSAKKEEIKEIIQFIKNELKDDVQVLYGGSVNIKNCKDFSEVCDGFLVGNASLEESFIDIVKSLEN